MKKLLLLVTLFLVSPVLAQASNNEVQQAENYLRRLGTMAADFVQTADNGSVLTGKFYLNRPGKLRFQYNEVDDFIVADGVFVYFYDSEMKEQTNAPIGQTLADFLLRPNLSLTKDLTVKDVVLEDGFQIITLAQKDDEGAGLVKLFFSQEPYALQKWQIVDAAGLTTEISLSNAQYGVKLNPSLFAYIAPKGDKPAFNQ